MKTHSSSLEHLNHFTSIILDSVIAVGLNAIHHRDTEGTGMHP